MFGRLARLPFRVLAKIRGLVSGKSAAAPAPAPAPVRPKPRPAPVREADEEPSGGHDHGHSHDHGGGRALGVTPEQTPNPNAMKFTLERKLAGKGSFTFNSAAEAASHPVGRALFEVAGVKSVFGVNNFVTVTKDDDASWDRLIAAVTAALQASA